MPYKLKTIDKKILRNIDCYYAIDQLTGQEEVVSKNWILQNHQYITNISVNRGSVYPVMDTFEIAVKRINQYYEDNLLKNYGLNISAIHRIILYPKYDTIYKTTLDSNIKQLIDYLKTMKVPTPAIESLHQNIINRLVAKYKGNGLSEKNNDNNDTILFINKHCK